MLRQAVNQIYIEGILSELDLRHTIVRRDGKEFEAIGGTITVRVDLVVDGLPKPMEIPVHLFSEKYLKNNPNQISKKYEHFLTIMDQYKSIAAVGEAEADRVRISGAEIRMNEFWAATGTLVSQARVSASFINRMPALELNPQANFTVEAAIVAKRYMTDANGDLMDPMKYEVVGIVPGYNGRVQAIRFHSEEAPIADFFENNINLGDEFDTLRLNGYLNFTSEEVIRETEVAVGEPEVRTFTRRVSEFIIKGSTNPLTDLAFDTQEIIAAEKERKAFLESRKEAQLDKKPTRQTPSATVKVGKEDLGF